MFGNLKHGGTRVDAGQREFTAFQHSSDDSPAHSFSHLNAAGDPVQPSSARAATGPEQFCADRFEAAGLPWIAGE